MVELCAKQSISDVKRAALVITIRYTRHFIVDMNVAVDFYLEIHLAAAFFFFVLCSICDADLYPLNRNLRVGASIVVLFSIFGMVVYSYIELSVVI